MSATQLVPVPGTDLVPDGWCEQVVIPWADEQYEQASLANASAHLAGLEAAYRTLGADTLELTKARRYLEVRWGELLGTPRPGRRTDLNPSHASEGLPKDDRHRFRQLAAARPRVIEMLRSATDAEDVTRAGLLKRVAANKDAERKERGAERRAAFAAEEGDAPTGTAVFMLGSFAATLSTVAGAGATLLLTDPPYGVGYKSGFRWASAHDAIHGDAHAHEATAAFADALHLSLDALAADAHVLTFCGWRTEPAFRAVLESAGLAVRSSLIWVKNEPGMGDLAHSFGPMHERIIHATRGDAQMRYRAGDVFTCARVVSARHPTEKPTDLLDGLIRATTNPGDLVLDPFAGVASTLVAARDAGRRAWGCELNPDYHAHGNERL